MESEKVSADIPFEENGKSESGNEVEEPSDVSSSLQKDEDEGKGAYLLIGHVFWYVDIVVFIMFEYVPGKTLFLVFP